MPDILAEALGFPDLGWLFLIIFVAGVVRGFSGFGTALIFVPLAAIFLPPIWVLVALIVVDLTGPLPLVPRAIRDGSLRDVGTLLLGCVICVPLGTLVLQIVDPKLFRWIVGLVALGMVTLLISGWRHNATLGRGALLGIGGASGFLGGVTGIPGPPVILAYMSGHYDPARIRANILLYLIAFDFLLALAFLVQGLLVAEALVLGVVLILPYLAGNLVGVRIFDPARARLYRGIAYGIITASAVIALPLFG